MPPYRDDFSESPITLTYHRTVFDNVAITLVISGYRHQEINRCVRAALNKVRL